MSGIIFHIVTKNTLNTFQKVVFIVKKINNMKDFLKKLFGKSNKSAEQQETETPVEEISSSDEQSEERTM